MEKKQASHFVFKALGIALLLFTFFGTVQAQEGSLRGHVYDKETGEPIIYGNVFLKDTNFGANTDLDGLFNLTNIPSGDYILQVSYIGYETAEVPVTIKTGVKYEKVFLDSGGVQLEAVDISARREVARSEVQISKLEVTQKEITMLPSTGGEADILQYLQVLPGIVSTGDQGGQIYIRGGSPIQNKIMLDGLTIYNPFHSVGFYSVFETELIKNVDVLTGGFNAEHGGRISAVVDIKTREGNKKRFGGQVSASPFMGKALLEGPIIKLEEDKGSLSFVLTGKQSLISETSKTLYDYASRNDSIGLPFSFTDLYGKISYATNNGSKFNFFGFNFQDDFDDPSVAKIGWTTSGGGMNFNLLPANSSLILNGTIGFSDYQSEFKESAEAPRSSGIREIFMGLDFGFFANTYEFNYGLEVKSIRTDFDFTNPFGVSLSQFQNTTELAGFFKFRKAWDKVVIEPSIRMQYYASLSEPSFEPRFGLKYNITDFLRFKAAGGLYSQNLISADNERDVVKLFTGFLSGPDQNFLDLDGMDVSSKLQTSRHLIAGFEIDPMPNMEVNLEGYIKDFPQLVIINRNRLSVRDADYATETGEAYGVDLSVKYQQQDWYLWGTYSLAYVNRFDGIQEYRTVFDRRHNFNFLASYNFGANKDWQASFRWNFGSGFPFTQTQAFYNYLPFLDGVSTDYLTSNPDNVGIIYSDVRNGGQLPDYHRLDLSVQKTFEFTKNVNLEVLASITNAYDRDNIFYFDRIRYERVDQLPILPSVGLKLNF